MVMTHPSLSTSSTGDLGDFTGIEGQTVVRICVREVSLEFLYYLPDFLMVFIDN